MNSSAKPISTRVTYAPAVAEVVAVAGSAETVTLVLTLDEAGQVAALIGETCWKFLPGLFDELHNIPGLPLYRTSGTPNVITLIKA